MPDRKWIIGGAVAVLVVVLVVVAFVVADGGEPTPKQQASPALTLEQVKAWPVCGPKAPPPQCRGDGHGRLPAALPGPSKPREQPK